MVTMYFDEDRKERDVSALDVQSRFKETVLHIAAKNNDWSLCSLLLRCGANPDLKNSESETFWGFADKLDAPFEMVRRWKEMERALPKRKGGAEGGDRKEEEEAAGNGVDDGHRNEEGGAAEEEVVGEDENKKSIELKRRLVELARINSSKHRVSKHSGYYTLSLSLCGGDDNAFGLCLCFQCTNGLPNGTVISGVI